MFSILTRFVNAKYLIKTQHLSRITFGTVVGLTSFIIISVCCAFYTIPAMFQVSLVASILVGIQMAIGESTLLGFLKNFPGETVGFFGSGTGFAGISGSGSLILLKCLNLSNSTIYLIAAPTMVPYYISFNFLTKQKRKFQYVEETESVAEDGES